MQGLMVLALARQRLRHLLELHLQHAPLRLQLPGLGLRGEPLVVPLQHLQCLPRRRNRLVLTSRRLPAHRDRRGVLLLRACRDSPQRLSGGGQGSAVLCEDFPEVSGAAGEAFPEGGVEPHRLGRRPTALLHRPLPAAGGAACRRRPPETGADLLGAGTCHGAMAAQHLVLRIGLQSDRPLLNTLATVWKVPCLGEQLGQLPSKFLAAGHRDRAQEAPPSGAVRDSRRPALRNLPGRRGEYDLPSLAAEEGGAEGESRATVWLLVARRVVGRRQQPGPLREQRRPRLRGARGLGLELRAEGLRAGTDGHPRDGGSGLLRHAPDPLRRPHREKLPRAPSAASPARA
mmetsp:Transcript_22349/g.62434  ORF Transcript_22349/g.62434 Transcript_22349/m.62434 type:complete len:345 (-) Transcript_22349:74-1108(-)